MSDAVIVLREECILAAEGKAGRMPKITKARRIPVEGFGNTMEQWKKALETCLESLHADHVKLVLPASYSSARITQIPYATGKQLGKIAKNVMQENESEGVADYSVVQGDKKQGLSLCCGSTSEKFISDLTAITRELGIPVDAVSVPLEGYLRLMSQLKECRNRTAIYLIFEDSSVTSLLYRDGVYQYSTRSRIFSERGTLDFGTEIVRNISGIRQFYATMNADMPITDVYYTGCAPDDFEASLDGIRAMNLEVRPLEVNLPFEAPGNPGDWLACIGAMITDKKNINLYDRWLTDQKKDGVGKVHFGKELVPPAVTLAVCLVLFAGVAVWNGATSARIRKMDRWMQDSAVQEQYRQAEERKNYSASLSQSIAQVNRMEDNLATYPDLTEGVIREIEDVSGRDMDVKIQGLDMETGTLTFNAVSRQVIDIPGYVSRLTTTGLFEEVNYTGYSYGDNEYTLSLSCVLAAADAGEVQ